ncbi:MAG: hypothetical protein AABZ31_03085 [Bdellovibrionota bacterium]
MSFVKRLTRSAPLSFQSNSIQKIAHNHNLAQRQNSRISYAHIGAVGDLPQVYFNGDEMNVGNISSGGVLIIDDASQLGSTVGETIHLELRWVDYTAKIKSRIVGANLQRRHIQFTDFNMTATSRINRAVEYGLPGAKFYQAHQVTINPQLSSIDALEVWLDQVGNSIVFPKPDKQPHLAEFTYNNKKFFFSAHQWPIDGQTSRLLTPEEISEVLILLANFKNPSPRIRYLIEKLNFLHLRPQGSKKIKTGT